MTRGAVLWAALSLAAPPCAAQELDDEVLDLLQARGCAMEVAALEEVFTVMGRDRAEVAATIEALVRSGSATLARGTVRLAADLCRPEPAPQQVPPLPWLEERLAESPDCRRRLSELRREAEEGGIVPEALDSVAAALESLGRIVVEDGAARLRADLCQPGSDRDRGLDRVLTLADESFRAVLGMLALERDCRIPLDDPETLLRDLGLVARRVLLLADDLSEEAQRALSRRIGAALEDPGPAFRREGGTLVARYCLP